MLTYQRFRVHIKRTLALSIPVIISQIGHVAVSVADSVMVGRLGAEQLAGCSLGISMLSVFTVLGIGLAYGITPNVAQAFGAKKIANIRDYYSNVIVYSVVLGFALVLLSFLSMQTLQFFSYPLQVIHYAQEYLIWMSISLFPLLVFLGLKQFYEGLGNTRIAMIISVVFNLLNILLNYLLIFGHWNLPAMGVEGASLATLISRLGMALTMFITVYSTRKYIEFVPKIDLSHVTWSRIKSILRLGIPSSMQYVFEVGAFSAAALMIGFLGAEALAAHQIAINIASITYMMATGLSMGASVLAAQAFGRKNMHEVKLAGNSAFVLVGLFMMLTALIFIVFNHALAGLYTQEQNVLAIAAPLLIIASIFQLADGFQAVGIGLLRGLSDVKRPTFYTFLSYWVICLPLGYVLGFTYKLGVYGIWVSLCVGLFVAAITLFYRFKNLLKNSI